MINKFNPAILSKLNIAKQIDKAKGPAVDLKNNEAKAETEFQALKDISAEIHTIFNDLEKNPAQAGVKHLGGAVQHYHNLAAEFLQTVSTTSNVGVGASMESSGDIDSSDSGYEQTLAELNNMQASNQRDINGIISEYENGLDQYYTEDSAKTHNTQRATDIQNDAAVTTAKNELTAAQQATPYSQANVDAAQKKYNDAIGKHGPEVKAGDVSVEGTHTPNILTTLKRLGPKITTIIAINNLQNTVLGDYKQTMKTFSQ